MPKNNTIYTRTGDKGKTSLYNNRSISKSHIIIEVIGTIDELNSQFGLMLFELSKEKSASKDIFKKFKNIQYYLFKICSYLAGAIPEYKAINKFNILNLEKTIDTWNSELSLLKHFIRPFGSPLISYMHICRSLVRKTERYYQKLRENDDTTSIIILCYFNRLSDVLFVAARIIAKRNGINEINNCCCRNSSVGRAYHS